MTKPLAMIAAITLDNALGKNGDMIYHISADLKRFKAITMGHPIIMGRRTFESFPKGALPGRRNMVITRQTNYNAPGIEVFPSLKDALDACADDEAYIIGGGQIYSQALPLATTLHITEINATTADADTYFPAIDPKEWRQKNCTPFATDERSGVRYRYVDYERKP